MVKNQAVETAPDAKKVSPDIIDTSWCCQGLSGRPCGGSALEKIKT